MTNYTIEKQALRNFPNSKRMKRDPGDFQLMKLSTSGKQEHGALNQSKILYDSDDKNNTRKSDRTKKERKIADYTEFTRFYHENPPTEGGEPPMEVEKGAESKLDVPRPTPSSTSRPRQKKSEKLKPRVTIKRKMIKKTGGKRGRPRLNPEEKKKRSLLRKADIKAHKLGAVKKHTAQTVAGASENDAVPAEPIFKRPPGRPRKYLTPEESAEAKRKSTFKQLKALSNISLYQAMVQVKDFLRRQKKNKVTKLV